MSYSRAIRIGLAVLWPFLMQSLLVGLLTLGAVYLVRHSTLIGSAARPTLEAVLGGIGAAFCYFVILPGCIQDAVSSEYPDFRILVVTHERDAEGLTFFKSLQVSLLALAIHAMGLFLLNAFIKQSFLRALIQIPLLVLGVYPGVAVMMVRVPFYGFRLKIVKR